MIHWDAQNLMPRNFGRLLGVEAMVSCHVGSGWIHGLQRNKGVRLEHPGRNNGNLMVVGSGEVGSLERGRAAYQAYWEVVHNSVHRRKGSEDHVDDHIGLHTVKCSWAEIHASESKMRYRAVPSAEEGTGFRNDRGHD